MLARPVFPVCRQYAFPGTVILVWWPQTEMQLIHMNYEIHGGQTQRNTIVIVTVVNKAQYVFYKLFYF